MPITQTLKNPTKGLKSIPKALSNTFKKVRETTLSDYKAGFAKAAKKAFDWRPSPAHISLKNGAVRHGESSPAERYS